MRTKLPNFMFRQFIAPNNSLLRYLRSLAESKPFTVRSWCWDGKYGAPMLSPDDVLAKWMEKLSQLKAGDEFDRNVYEFDAAQVEKYQPQGGHSPIEDLYPKIIAPSFSRGEERRTRPSLMWRPKQSKHAKLAVLWHKAKQIVSKILWENGVRNLRLKTPSGVTDVMHDKGTLESNSGFPDFGRRKDPQILENALNSIATGEYKSYPAIVLIRRYNGKERLVWMYPLARNLVEGTVFFPIFQAIQKSTALMNGFFAPWQGFEAVRKAVTKAYSRSDQCVFASDFSATDEHFQMDTSNQVLDVILPLFQAHQRDQVREIVLSMHTVPLLMGPNDLVTGHHGVSSGSMFTNFIETIFDLVLATFCHLARKVIKGLYGIGDDMAWVYKLLAGQQLTEAEATEFAEWLEDIGDLVGQEINSSKTMVAPNKVKTLQRLFQRGYYQRNSKNLRGVYPTVRALKSLVYPERFINPKRYNARMFCVRVFMILENCVDHPLFEEFVRFVLSSNPHLPEFAKQSAAYQDQAQQEANLIPGLNDTYNQEKRASKLSEFASIRLAAKIA